MGIIHLRKLTFVFVVLISFIFMTWVGTLTAGASEKKPVKIGVLVPLSTPGSVDAGKRIVWAVELAVKYVNEEMGGVLSGRPVEIVVEDSAGTPSVGIAAFRKLVQKDGVVAVVGFYHSSVMLAINPLANDLGIPVFAAGAAASKITESHYPTVFRTLGLPEDTTVFRVGFLKAMGFKRMAIMAEDTDYGTEYANWYVKVGTEEGMEVKKIVFPRKSPDFTPALLEIKAWKPDVVVDICAGAAAYLIVKQAYDIGLFPKVPIFAAFEWPVRPEFWDAVGETGKYITFAAYYKPGMPVGRLGEWMISRYRKLHNEYPEVYFLNAFGHVLIIAQALNQAQSDNPKALTKALVDWPFSDWSGVVKFEEGPGARWHNVSPPNVICQVTEVRQSFENTKLLWPPQLGGDGKIVRPPN